ncbi:OsmC family protein [Bosea sp. (in: a-proteobacteria)]|jgi:organic hydroperoxide reductase OsmC/OhrA|uniref:OsmC family protein n=1 Tax=Bosea sp. (in: a-proteobacteria) TaxID=1871050 RepID=UPI002DDD0E40|nr:OsmC family protein [Bosea sp. (in: a-proteobacteria)]HEV2511450.1 OsmC family protein [Bosea sp. (in: a-proteobacteria)]
MAAVTIELRNVEGTQAAMGWAGAHTVVVDRPEGKAGGMGLGFNGAQLLALGGCFCNDLRYAAHELGVGLGRIAVSVTVELEGAPLLTTAATMSVQCEMEDGSDASTVIEKAKAICMVANSLGRGFPVAIAQTGRS